LEAENYSEKETKNHILVSKNYAENNIKSFFLFSSAREKLIDEALLYKLSLIDMFGVNVQVTSRNL